MNLLSWTSLLAVVSSVDVRRMNESSLGRRRCWPLTTMVAFGRTNGSLMPLSGSSGREVDLFPGASTVGDSSASRAIAFPRRPESRWNPVLRRLSLPIPTIMANSSFFACNVMIFYGSPLHVHVLSMFHRRGNARNMAYLLPWVVVTNRAIEWGIDLFEDHKCRCHVRAGYGLRCPDDHFLRDMPRDARDDE